MKESQSPAASPDVSPSALSAAPQPHNLDAVSSPSRAGRPKAGWTEPSSSRRRGHLDEGMERGRLRGMFRVRVRIRIRIRVRV